MTERLSDSTFDKNYRDICERIEKAAKSVGKTADDIILLAATKTQDIETVNHAIKSGIKYIGENRVQEFLQKKDGYLPVHRHFIGHLQSNKVKYIVGEVELIHSVDSVSLAREISKVALKRGVIQDILLEVNIAAEESKSGFTPADVLTAVGEISKFEGIKIKGLMAIPPALKQGEENTAYFEQMNKLFIDIGAKKIDNVSMELLSMGMSGDFESAVMCGANLVRIGTALFGERNHNK